MCGISGIWHLDGRHVDTDALGGMGACLKHRGPDDDGAYASGGIGLAHTRLSILDLSAEGRQPMRSPDGRFVIAYNGEVYNFPELRRSLEQLGHRFRGHSDTEVVLHAFTEWGEDALPKLEGMFAMAVWDERDKRLCLARDRFGIKPLYYQTSESGIVFGSEIKSLLASGEVQARLDWHGLHEYLYYDTALGPRTLYRGVRKLPPGHKLVQDELGCRVEPFCSIFDVEQETDDYPTAAEKVRHLLERAVRAHLVSDVPVGVFLSGGIDSSAITAFASKHYGGRLKTFAAGFDFVEGLGTENELPKARMVADRFGTDHQEIHVAGGDVSDVIERLVACHDAPFGDGANIPLYLMCEQLGGGHKVILQGDGGDELFAGYRMHSLMALGAVGEGCRRVVFLGRSARPETLTLLPILPAAATADPPRQVFTLRAGDVEPDDRQPARPPVQRGGARRTGGARPVRTLQGDVPQVRPPGTPCRGRSIPTAA